jgi:DNA-binding CsgD family transcriptional regulator
MGSVFSNHLLDSLDAVDDANTVDELKTVIKRFVSRFGIHSYTSALITPAENEALYEVSWVADVPPQWFDHYMGEDYTAHDYGVRIHAEEKRLRPFLVGSNFEQRLQRATETEYKVYNECSEVGMKSGLIVPMVAKLDGSEIPTGYSLWSEMEGEQWETMLAAHGPEILTYLFAVKQKLLPKLMAARNLSEPLTSRETECLAWLARGLRPDAIADRINLATVTVNCHLRSARLKLGAQTMPHSVALAITMGLITP